MGEQTGKLPTLLERFRECKADENNEALVYFDADGVAEVIAALELKESLCSLPAMAEVDALVPQCWEWLDNDTEVIVEKIIHITRRAIAFGESERKRAEEAESAMVAANELIDGYVGQWDELQAAKSQLAERDNGDSKPALTKT